LSNLVDAAEQFRPSGKVIDIGEFGNGNINSTFLVTLDAGQEKHFILQRINARVFLKPELVMQNIRISTEHMGRRLRITPLIGGRRWEVPRMLLTHEGRDLWLDTDGAFWRAISFVEASRSYDTIKDVGHAREAGCALAMFHTLLSDLSPERLADTLEGFHITPRYLRRYNEVLAKEGVKKFHEVNYCLQFVKERSGWADVLENARAQGKLDLRTIHGDPKVSNIMVDIDTGRAVSIVDLDTVKPGLVHYDIGDCLRSGCNPLGEETDKCDKVHFDLDICEAILQGYFSTARDFLTENDFDYIYDSIRLLAFELGLRFFTDYLEGNVYFKVRHPEHNLVRALVQFKLTESIESQETALRGMIRDFR
jgi:Ser/Thr protein kinase RdoA (MazF antagonist)